MGARARFRIGPDARALIQRSDLEARRRLGDILGRQELQGADPQSLFKRCCRMLYELRDNQYLPIARPEPRCPRQPLLSPRCNTGSFFGSHAY